MQNISGCQEKVDWTEEQLEGGINYLLLMTGKEILGFIEYASGETSWGVAHVDGIYGNSLHMDRRNWYGLGSQLIQPVLKMLDSEGKELPF